MNTLTSVLLIYAFGVLVGGVLGVGAVWLVDLHMDREPEEKSGVWQIGSDGWYPFCPRCKQEPGSGNMTPYCPYCGLKLRRNRK
ncbi:MAG: hypothetical protein IJK40_04985 [Clostridia bacterium]|nr:hypothetical protein [Clostridia bacterium]